MTRIVHPCPLARLIAATLLVALGGLAAPAVAQFGLDALDSADGSTLVSMDLLSADGTIAPGTTEFIGVRLRIQPGWHVYWRNPGDSGTRPRLAVKPPSGLEVGEIAWPRPVIFDEQGDITYGYENEVILLVPVTASKTLALGTISIPVEAEWLVCKRACLFGDASGTIDLRVVSEEENRLRRRRDDLGEARKRLPTPIGKIDGATAKVETGTNAGTLVITGPAGKATDIRFIPDHAPGVTLGEGDPVKARIKDGRFRISVPVAVEPANTLGRAPVAAGVVTFGPRPTDPSFSLEIPLAE